jgi:hypothetical protein
LRLQTDAVDDFSGTYAKNIVKNAENVLDKQ